jgi:hypothetical protein
VKNKTRKKIGFIANQQNPMKYIDNVADRLCFLSQIVYKLNNRRRRKGIINNHRMKTNTKEKSIM